MSSFSNPKKVMIPCRFSFLHCWEPDSVNGSEPKYSVSAIIPKSDSDAGPCAGPALCDGFPAHLRIIPPEADAGHAVLEELLQVVCVGAGHPQRTLTVYLAGEIPLDGQGQSTLQRCVRPVEPQRVLVQPAGFLQARGIVEDRSTAANHHLVFLCGDSRGNHVEKEIHHGKLLSERLVHSSYGGRSVTNSSP